MKRFFISGIAVAVAAALLVVGTAFGGNGHGRGNGRGNAQGQQTQQGQQSQNTNGVRCVLNTQLRAANEPPVLSTAKGHAQLKVLNNGNLSYRVFILNKAGENFFAGHIHLTATKAIVQGLFAGPPTTARHIRIAQTIPIDPALATGLCTTPSNYYVNFHTTQDPAGAIRGNFS